MRPPSWLAQVAAVLCALTSAAGVFAEEPSPKSVPSSPDEPLAEKFSLQRGAASLDDMALSWTRERKCGSCHTNLPYLLARPALKESPSAALKEVRAFFEDRVANWDAPKGKPRYDAEVVATGAYLALNDAQTTGRLHPLTRKALDRAWTLQRPDGSWSWIKCNWPPFEYDDYYGAVLAALGVGSAPDGYAASESARAGVVKLRAYLRKTPAPSLHHEVMLLWASLRLEGLLGPLDRVAAEREATVRKLVALQRPDGGWNLPSLGKYKRHDKTPNNPDSPSDGYGTGLVVYVLRQAGVPAEDERIQRAVAWLKANQRASGQWFTRSLSNDRHHFIAHTGTAFAVLALRSCEE